MLHKSFELLETKAEGDSGQFTAIVSTFGNVDRVGDRILPGAWTKTLAKWTASGDPIPIILAHQWNDPMAHIGIAHPQDVQQVEKGLQVTGKLDVEDNPVAKQVYKLMKRRSLKEFSIGYDVPAGGEKRAKDGANEISQIELAECGPCLKGIDPKTELQGVKSALGLEPRDAETLRKETARVEREATEDRLPELKEPVPEFPPEPEPEPELEPEPAPEPPDPQAQRKEAERVAREAIEEQLPEIVAAAVDDSPLIKRVKELANASEQQIIAFARELVEEREPKPTKTAEELAKQASKIGLEQQRSLERQVIGDDKAATKASIKHAKEALTAQERFEPDEIAGIDSGLLKAVWTTAYINDLPDSSFLHIEAGGEKDADGKTTPRSLRHFPYKDASGAVDLPHLRNALSRIPQSSLPQDVEDRLTVRAQRILDNSKAAEVTDKEPKAARSVDPLRRQADAVALEFATDGLPHKPPTRVEQPKPEPELSLTALKQRMRDEMLMHLSGETI